MSLDFNQCFSNEITDPMRDDPCCPSPPVQRPFKCPHCQFSTARMHGLKVHIGAHNNEASKRFECSTCGRRFSRKHDLRRHCGAIHGERMLSSSSFASSVPIPRFDLGPYLPQYWTTTVSGDERLTSPLHPGPFSATDLEDLMARWENATWLQGA